jgi:hypothetical protein
MMRPDNQLTCERIVRSAMPILLACHAGITDETLAWKTSQFGRVAKHLFWWRPRPELNRGKRFCRPLRNHSATWPCRCQYVNARKRLCNSGGIVGVPILNAKICGILNRCSLSVR